MKKNIYMHACRYAFLTLKIKTINIKLIRGSLRRTYYMEERFFPAEGVQPNYSDRWALRGLADRWALRGLADRWALRGLDSDPVFLNL